MSKKSILTELNVSGLRERKIESGHFYPEPGVKRKANGGIVLIIFKDGKKQKVLILNGETYGGDTPVSRDIKYC